MEDGPDESCGVVVELTAAGELILKISSAAPVVVLGGMNGIVMDVIVVVMVYS